MVKRFIGQYWTVETHPWVDMTRSIPHEPVPTLTAHVYTVVFGQNYMRDGSYMHARINQLEQVDKITSRNINVASNLMIEIRSTTSMRSPSVIRSPSAVKSPSVIRSPSVVRSPSAIKSHPQEPGSMDDGLQQALDSPPQELRNYWAERETELNSGTRISHSPGIRAENDIQSHPGSVRRILTKVEGFTHAITDCTCESFHFCQNLPYTPWVTLDVVLSAYTRTM